ncbi:hypothetical protein P692DRAFT_20727554 [Suillus brevipes Sb2]|nr:hypothetical protein P692DRAFT_20727554 [Suillus brevipes Sb2]
MPRVVKESGPKLLKIHSTFSGMTPPISAESANCASKYRLYEPLFFLTDFTRELHHLKKLMAIYPGYIPHDFLKDPEYNITTYSNSTGTTTRRKHLFQVHTQRYIEVLESNRWPVYIPTLKQHINDGWTLAGIFQALGDPSKTIDSLGSPPNRRIGDSLPGTSGLLGEVLPEFSLDEMHRQLVKFIVVDDQVSHSLFICFCSQ